jgi:hypothetical protein
MRLTHISSQRGDFVKCLFVDAVASPARRAQLLTFPQHKFRRLHVEGIRDAEEAMLTSAVAFPVIGGPSGSPKVLAPELPVTLSHTQRDL